MGETIKLQLLLDTRGYLVVSTFLDLKIGQVVDGFMIGPQGEEEYLSQKAAVIGCTTREDFIDQSKISGYDPCLNSLDLPKVLSSSS